MDTPLSVDLPSEALRARVGEVVRRHWVRPHAVEPLAPDTKERVEEIARAALDTLLTRQFRVGPRPSPDVCEQFLRPIRRFVRKGRPIKITVGYGPLKNPNAVSHRRADWAEFFALCHLVSWHNKLQRVYAPGLQFQIIFDDETLLIANGADKSFMDSYISSIAELIRVLDYEAVFLPPTRLTRFMWFLRFGPYQMFRFCLLRIAEWRVRRWERDPAHEEQVRRMAEFARRNVVVPANLGPEERERFVRDASHRFRVCWDALRLGARIFPDRERLVALYLDGSQHHRTQLALHLTSVDKGQMTQPWQGEGVLLDNGHGKLEPFVLTAGRRPRYRARILDGLDLVPAADFDHIAVVWPEGSAAASPVDTPTVAESLRDSARTRGASAPQ
jgi:hypothetical protein